MLNRPPPLANLKIEARRAPARVIVTSLVALICFASAAIAADRADTPASADLSAAERIAVARAFAPTFVFHPSEDYFPTNAMRGPGSDDPVTDRPESWRDRVTRYRELSTAEKLQRAAVAYRVFTRTRGGEHEVVVEYWCYYVFNAFTVRGGWLPYRVADDHPHDLERVYLVLTRTSEGGRPETVDETWARDAFRIRSVIANAHDGSIPPNEFDAIRGDTLRAPLNLLVERGSHAMAPDIDGDGRFTPGVDSTAILKLQWGIRDNGSTWGWYRSSFMDARGQSAVRLCGPSTAEAAINGCSHYALYPADDLPRWFAGLQLSQLERRDVVGQTSLLIRAFGDVRIEQLMVPTDPPDGSMLDSMRGRRTAEAGFVVGFKTVARAPALILARRDFWPVQSRHLPDIMSEAVAIFPNDGRRAFEATVWGSYSLDAITNLLLGVGWFSHTGAADVVGGVDLRIGRWRVRPSWRLFEGKFDSRLTTTF